MSPYATDGAGPVIADEHSVLLWQACAYADDLTDAAGTGRRLGPAHDAMLGFLHYRLLPYLSAEELRLPPARLRDEHMLPLLLTDHERLRADVENVETSRTRRLLSLAAAALVDRLDRHVRREQSWVKHPDPDAEPSDEADWALPLLLEAEIDLDAVAPGQRTRLLRRRLGWMRPGEVVHVESAADLHSEWRRHQAASPHSHVWTYEQDGPVRWRVRVTRRDPATR
jgi:uncharacterized protein (DUF2249 family)